MFSYEVYKIFKNICFYRALALDAFVSLSHCLLFIFKWPQNNLKIKSFRNFAAINLLFDEFDEILKIDHNDADHCVKSVRRRSFFWSVFPTFGLNTERYSVTLRIQSECGKTRTRKTSVFAHFSRSGWIIFFVKWLAVKSMVNSLCQPHKIVKRTQAICRLLPTNCLSEFNHFVGMALKDLRSISCETSVTHYSKPLIRHDEFFIVIFLF